jgi:tetratricopeptide (TPR) repeat protein
MTEKIALFEEVLRLEPNSKLFFPLAQAYAQDHRTEDAVAILRKGLTFHPEHLEARLLLIECLTESDVASRNSSFSAGGTPAAEALSSPELESLTKALVGHPSFWRHWAARSRAEGRTDLAVTLDMLAFQLSGTRINWDALLEQGLRAVTGGRKEFQAPAPLEEDDSKLLKPEPLSVLESVPDPEPVFSPSPEQDTEPKPETDTTSDAVPEPAQTFPSESETVARQSPEAQAEVPLSEGERRYYETKTYADLLAKQGEHDEALDLFAKLLQTSPDDEQRQDLKARIQELRDRSTKGQREPDFQQTEPGEPESRAEPETKPEPEPEPESDPNPEQNTEMEETSKNEDDPVATSMALSTITATRTQTLKKLAERLESRAGM